MLTQYKTVFMMIFITLWLPLVFNYLGYVFVEKQWIQFALHSLIEVTGAVLAMVIGIALSQAVAYQKLPNIFDWVARAFIALAVLDIIHATMNVETLFVWFHSMSGFFASLILIIGALVQLTSLKIPLPTKGVLVMVVVAFAILSIQFEGNLPKMTDSLGEFSFFATMINLFSGAMFVAAGLYFTSRYFKLEAIENLMIAGFCFLMVASELSFAISSLWDFSWWGWHLLRLFAFIGLGWFFYEWLKKGLEKQFKAQSQLETQLQSTQDQCCQIKQYADLLDKTSLVSRSDLEGDIIDVNDRLLDSTGYRREELIGQPHSIFNGGNTPQSTYKKLWETIRAGKLWTGQIQNRKKNGRLFTVNIAISPIKDKAGEIIEYLAARQDITDAVEREELLSHYRTHDELTGFKSRQQLIQDLDAQQIEKIALLNIDDSKEINDFFGMTVGNELVRQVGEALAKLKDSNLRIYRMHGDEFALATTVNHPFPGFDAKILEWVNALAEMPFDVNGQIIYITLKAGIAEGIDSSLTAADMALKVAKKTKRTVVTENEIYLFSHQYKENDIWTQSLKHAFLEDGIQLFYQPVYDLKKQTEMAYECLVRLCKDGDYIEPRYFLEVAKKTRLYSTLTNRVLSLAFESFHDRSDGFSVNICAEDMVKEETLIHLNDFCQTYCCASRLALEFTEAEAQKNLPAAIEFINKVKALGIQIAIDDVGKGAINFETLLKLQPDYIKIDGTVIADLIDNENSKLMVETLVGFAHKRKIKVIVEAVETQAQFLKLKTLKVDFVQGFFTGKPDIILPDNSEKA